jgi:hypothetical protein
VGASLRHAGVTPASATRLHQRLRPIHIVVSAISRECRRSPPGCRGSPRRRRCGR